MLGQSIGVLIENIRQQPSADIWFREEVLVFGKINFEKTLGLVLLLAATEVSRPQQPPPCTADCSSQKAHKIHKYTQIPKNTQKHKNMHNTKIIIIEL